MSKKRRQVKKSTSSRKRATSRAAAPSARGALAVATSARKTVKERVAAMADATLAVCDDDQGLQSMLKVLRDRKYKGWAIFDLDGPREGDDGFDAIGGNLDLAVDDYLSHNVNYLRVMLGIKLPPYV